MLIQSQSVHILRTTATPPPDTFIWHEKRRENQSCVWTLRTEGQCGLDYNQCPSSIWFTADVAISHEISDKRTNCVAEIIHDWCFRNYSQLSDEGGVAYITTTILACSLKTAAKRIMFAFRTV